MGITAVGLPPLSTFKWRAFARHWLSFVQLAASVIVVWIYHIDGPVLSRVLLLAAVGFAVSVVLPFAYRMWFFVGLSFLGIIGVLGPADGGWLIAVGLLLLGTCHLPIRISWRVLLILLIASALAIFRNGWVEAPWSASVWPVLGSMFMFRLILYVRALVTREASFDLKGSLAYFFMLPNVAFPLFPVVDYQTFRKTYFDQDEKEIYERGAQWISRGLLHLILHRFLYQNLLNVPDDIADLSSLAQFMTVTFLLYLRVSGQFHLIVGMLHLFGFRLPDTHRLYFLARGFSDLWRRMNIYWTGFMTKAVFYPIYFRVKRFGPSAALAFSTAAVFSATWFLHSYQWFWLQGSFPIKLQETLYWSIMAALVFANTLREFRRPRSPAKTAPWSWNNGLKAAGTFLLMCFLWSLWSSESLDQWLWMLGGAMNVNVSGALLIGSIFATIVLLGSWEWLGHSRSATTSSPLQLMLSPKFRSVGSLAALVALAQPALQQFLPDPYGAILQALRRPDLNARDAFVRDVGYYAQVNSPQPVNTSNEGGFQRLAECMRALGRMRQRDDYLLAEFNASLSIRHECFGTPQTFSTNRWGMRDKEYTLEKEPDSLRIEIFGPSHVAGWGVADDEVFDQIVEERLNKHAICPEFRRVEILNFAVDGYSVLRELGLLEEKGFQFSPDIVLLTVVRYSEELTAADLPDIAEFYHTIPFEPVKAMLAGAGLDTTDRRDNEVLGMLIKRHGANPSSLPVPFQSWRDFARSIGVETHIPPAELRGRSRAIAGPVSNWAYRRFHAVSTSHNAIPIALATGIPTPTEVRGLPVIRAVEQSSLPIINILDVFPTRDYPTLIVAPWDGHPNARGHQLMADRLHAELLPFIRTACHKRRVASNVSTQHGSAP